MKDLSIFSLKILFFLIIPIRVARQSISSCICFVLVVDHLKVVIIEFLGLTDLIRTQVFFIYKLTKIVIVSKDKDLMFTIF